jgi:hypothetical protein
MDGAPGGEAPARRAVPHSPQNFCRGACGAPQDGHRDPSGPPHSVQNLAPSWTSAEH